jgi:hypothetical protein
VNYKTKTAMKKSKKSFIIFIILWLILTIVFVVPLAYSIFRASNNGTFNMDTFFKYFGKCITVPFQTFGLIFSRGAFGTLMLTESIFTAIFSIFFFIGFVKSRPKHEYTDVEHGSSDWCEKGEQYKILSKDKGLILAKDNYLPIDKSGNINVLIVGRIWCW